MPTASATRLPFTAASAAYARRVALPSNKWSDLWREKHSEAFTVAGTLTDSGTRALEMIQEAVREAIEHGESKQKFAKRFDEIAAKTGWDYRGGRDFRVRTIYRTNLMTSFAAGRYEQLQVVKEDRPYWQYVHGGSAVPRPEHLAWDGLILHCDHPWWQTHFPPNGFGCTCSVRALDRAAVERIWAQAGGKGSAPELTPTSPGIAFGHDDRGQLITPHIYGPDDSVIQVSVPGRGVVLVPRGIDPGWDYSPGDAAAQAKAKADGDAAREAVRSAEQLEEAGLSVTPDPPPAPDSGPISPPPEPTATMPTSRPSEAMPAPSDGAIREAWEDESTPPPKEPSVPLGRIHSRHFLDRVTGSSAARAENTLVLPGTPVWSDLRDIKAGRAIESRDREGNPIWAINGRVYSAHDEGGSHGWAPFPVQGDGLIQADLLTYRVLKKIASARDEASARRWIGLIPFPRSAIENAWRIWSLGGGRHGRK